MDSHRTTADLSIETLQARREWQDILKVMKGNNLQPRLLYPAGPHSKMKDSAIKKNTFESVLMRWMKLEPIIQSEVSQKEKHQYSILTHIYGI